MSQKISVLLIAQNAESFLDRCLTSLRRFEEVVYVDGGSSDRSVEVASKYSNVVIYHNPWPGFIEQRNFSLTKASHEWCFMIDADEALEADAVEEIYKRANQPNDKVMFRIVRTEYYLGQALESGFGKSDYQERLFLKDRVQYSGGNHHQHLIDGKHSSKSPNLVADLDPKFRVLHDPTYGLNDVIKKFPRFVLLGADEKMEKGKKVSALIVLVSFIGTFFQIYLKSLRLGRVGFIIAVQNAIFRTLVKLSVYERQHIGFDKEKSTQESLG